MGKLEGAHHVLFSELEAQLAKIPVDQPVLLVDEAGNESPEAAVLLSNLGLKNVNILFEGMDAWMDEEVNHGNSSVIKWNSHPTYQIISADQFDKMMKSGAVAVIDIRNHDQFSNQSKNYWENIGKIKTAVNIPYPDLGHSTSLPAAKETSIVLYSFNNQNEVYEAAKALRNKGYKNVYVLRGGIWNLRWSAYNLKGKSQLKDWVVDVPEQNL
jgi:rhodanese-related sulfurtransferase